MSERKVLVRFDADKVRAEVAIREKAIAEQELIAAWLDQQLDDVRREVHRQQMQLREFVDLTHEPAAKETP